ncbi:MAG TPA: hypothetical protein VGO58_02080 [Chitinophagaceae bacterium]|jgi:hypothetical protein|nr:hypothetical protein [Chitinophagaceae bacterium]
MTPVEKGVFCSACKKEVTDFSGMSDKEIINHLALQQFQPSCGRFRQSQLNRPLVYISPGILTMDIPLWKKFLAALFICFSGLLTGCDSNSVNTDITEAVASSSIVRLQAGTIASVKEIKDPAPPKKIKTSPGKKKGWKKEVFLMLYGGFAIANDQKAQKGPGSCPVLFPKPSTISLKAIPAL